MYKSYNAPSIILNEYSELAQNEAIKLELFETFVEENGSEKESNIEFFKI